MILTNDPIHAVEFSDAEGIDIDDFRRERLVPCRAGQGHMGSVLHVVMGFVVAQDAA